MDRDEALEILGAFANYLDAGPTAKHHIKQLREVIAALSSPCACEGRVPVEKGKRWASTVEPLSYSMVKGGHYKNLVEVMVFALPEEKPSANG